uniref:WW domain-containing protein n=1 Tax=Lotharella oceanica TaxID=641309 RepID=A0A7S2TW85_9EUKA|mmetsp:Transcript_32754/g.60906  ORF Transcript_32754/g.60906 Transcript_32754/m.60906 type:complete len:305 (+) Transcript_32754:391-1305(+)
MKKQQKKDDDDKDGDSDAKGAEEEDGKDGEERRARGQVLHLTGQGITHKGIAKGWKFTEYKADPIQRVDEPRPGVKVFQPRKFDDEAPLPPGWTKQTLRNGKVGYYNLETRQFSPFPPEITDEEWAALADKPLEERAPREKRGEDTDESQTKNENVSWEALEQAKERSRQMRKQAVEDRRAADAELEKMRKLMNQYVEHAAELQETRANLTATMERLNTETALQRVLRELNLDSEQAKRRAYHRLLNDPAITEISKIPAEFLQYLGQYGADARKVQGQGNQRFGLNDGSLPMKIIDDEDELRAD